MIEYKMKMKSGAVGGFLSRSEPTASNISEACMRK